MEKNQELIDTFDIKTSQDDQQSSATYHQKIKEFSTNTDNPTILIKPNQPLEKKSKKWFILVIVILLLIIGGGILAYNFYFRLTPEKLANLIVDKMLNTRSFTYQGELVFSGNQPINLKFDGKTDSLNSQNIKNSLLITAEFTSAVGSFNPEAEFRWLNNDSYFRLNLSGLPLPIQINEQYNNQWFKTDIASAKNNLNLPLGQSNLPEKITTEQLIYIKDLINKLNLFSNLKEFKREKINQTTTRHFAFELNKEAIGEFLVEFGKNILNQPLSDQELNNINETLDQISPLIGEMWIGTKDYYLYKLILPLKIEDNNNNNNNNNNNFTKIDFKIELNNFGQPSDISAPLEYKTFTEFQQSLSNNFNLVTTTPSQILPTNLDSDDDGLVDSQEEFYQTDKQNPDSDGDGYLDGEEVINGYNPLGPGKI